MASASCVSTGSIASQNCDASYIQQITNAGSSSLTISDETTVYVRMAPLNASTTPTQHTLRITGNTTIYNPAYAAIYTYTDAQDHDLELYLGGDVVVGSDGGGLGAIWLRNQISGDISVESAATVTSTSGPAITVTTNQGAVSIINSGSVTATTDRGIYADGGYNDSDLAPVEVSIDNSGTVDAYLAGIRAINWHGLSTIENSGVVTSETLQGLIAWSASGAVDVTNSGTVTAEDSIALQAWSTAADVTVYNSGELNSHDDTAHADAGSGHYGIHARADTSGNITVTNSTGGVVNAPDSIGIYAQTDSGNVTITNSGRINALTGIDAVTGSGTVGIVNMGEITASGNGVTLRGGRLTNSGSISGNVYGLSLDVSGSIVTNSGTISGDVASVYFATGGNTLNISPNAKFTGVVDYNNTTGNTTAFGSGSYHIPAANYIAAGNTIRLDNSSQLAILANADTSGSIDVISAAPEVGKAVGSYTNSVSDVIGSILAIDIDRPTATLGEVNTGATFYAEPTRKSPAENAIASITHGTVVDPYGTLLWARVFGGGREQSGSGSAPESNIYHYGLIFGADRQFDNKRLGIFAGGGAVSASSAESGNWLEGSTGFAGVYAAAPVSDLTLNASLTLGMIDSDSKRSINSGAETAEGNFLGWYASPEFSLSRRYSIASDWTMTPSAGLRYVGAYYEGYDESGSSQNLSYAGRDSHSLEGRFQLEFSRHFAMEAGRKGSISFSGAITGRQNLGSDSYVASLNNTEFSLESASDRNVLGATLGIGFDVPVSATTNIYGAVEGSVNTDQSKAYTGRIGMKAIF